MNSYEVLKEKISKKYNDFPFIVAFTNADLHEKLEKRKLTIPDIVQVMPGTFIAKSDSGKLKELIKWADNARQEAINNDSDGSGYIKEMFEYELWNHEYGYTYDLDDTLNALGLTLEKVKADKKLDNGLQLALKKYREQWEG